MEIYILSSGRPFRQTTFNNLPKVLQERTKIVVPWLERDTYKNYPVLSDPAIIMNVTRTRQWLIERAVDKILMLDDDLVFSVRRRDEPTKFHNATNSDLVEMVKAIDAHLDNCAHVGVSPREGANRNTDEFLRCIRAVRVLAYDPDILRRENVRIDRLLFMSDFDVTLQLLRKGYPNIILNNWVHNQAGSNTAGGCSQYRTKELQEADARKLHQLHPLFVRLVEKKGWAGAESRTDVTVQWKKAYNSHANSD